MNNTLLQSPKISKLDYAHFFGSKLTKNRYLDICLVLILTFGSRYRAPFDGVLYLSSAKSIFTSEMPFQYHWIREPLLPILLKFSHFLFGPLDLGYVFIQSLLIVSSARLLVSRALVSNPIFANLVMGVICLNSLTSGYAGSVLQQTLISVSICFITWFTLGALQNRSSKRTTTEAIWVGFLSVMVSIFLIIPLLASSLVLIITKQKSKRPSTQLKSKNQTSTLKIITALLISATASTLIWSGAKALQLRSNPNPELPPWLWSYSSPPYTPEGHSKYEAIVPLLNLNKFVETPWADENSIFASAGTNQRCGLISDTPQKYFSYAGDYLQTTCRPIWATKLFGEINSVSNAIVAITLLLGFVMLFISIFSSKKEIRAVLWPAYALIIFYWFQGAGLSRYGFPAFATAAIAVFTLFSKFRVFKNVGIKQQSQQI